MSSNISKRELLRRKRQQEKRKNTITFLAIAAALIVLIGLAAILPRIFNPNANLEQVEGFYLGDPDAPVTVVEFSNYTCGHCKTFAETQEADLISEYVDTGKVYFRYVNFSSDAESAQNAAEASYCAADQNKFFDYKTYLFNNAFTEGGFSTESLINYAESADLDVNEFSTCLDSDTFQFAYLEDKEYARTVGIPGTPSFLVNDELVYASELFTTIDEALKGDS